MCPRPSTENSRSWRDSGGRADPLAGQFVHEPAEEFGYRGHRMPPMRALTVSGVSAENEGRHTEGPDEV